MEFWITVYLRNDEGWIMEFETCRLTLEKMHYGI